MCEKYGLPYPKTQIITKKMFEENAVKQPFAYPVALKAANSIEWLEVDFEGRKKAFRIQNDQELSYVLEQAYHNGYQSDFILQDFIPGDDSKMRVLNAYVAQNSHVKMMCMGHRLLEDPEPDAIGNYVAILPDFNQEICDKIKSFLEAISFTGYANFDMKYDERDHSYKLFEMNLRQGRSSFFVTLFGYNLAQWVVRDYVVKNLKDAPIVLAKQDKTKDALWLGVPPTVFAKYARQNDDKKLALALIKQKRYGKTYEYAKDMNFKRWLLIKWLEHNYAKNFDRYFKENKG